jgi:hypothetical protein
MSAQQTRQAPRTSQQPIFYKKVVPLSKERHKALYMEAIPGFSFAAETNSIYVAAVEFPLAAAEYPIVFGRDPQGQVFPLVLLGLRKGENLFVDKEGRWDARYIPAYARRYPFILATPPNNAQQFTVCIDESYPGFNTAKEGQALFDGKGQESRVLKQAIDFLKEYQKHVQLTTAFCQQLVELDLLEPVQASISLKSGEKHAISGFQCVSRKKLKALQPKKLTEMLKSDQMELIFDHLVSLNHIGRLAARAG